MIHTQQQTLLISGGSSGIGRSCVDKYLANDIKVINCDIQNLELAHPNYVYYQVDVSNSQQLKLVIDNILKDYPVIDYLIISAGKHLSANIENTTEEQLLELINLNLLGAFWLIKYILPVMKKQQKGSIVTIGSDQSTITKPNSTVYGMTKAAILSLTKSIAIDYAKYNIRANCIGAGTIDTPLYQAAIQKHAIQSGVDIAKINKEEAQCQPIGRIGTSKEVAELAFFLTSDNANFMTGALIPLDGGYTAQ